jgi:hypothetical protein
MPVDTSVVEPALKLFLLVGKKVNGQRPSQQVKKARQYIDAARDEFEGNLHLMHHEEAKRLSDERNEQVGS